ncbi:hypothetical protein CLG94_02610 [Candidatus Methylomirabilis limnetica]|uniref:Tyr recombinase domain-containing protein n=1 Tax=Candidatus Methylomirabilis limnetica TaxID=2033718 RepID=A0A2T4U0A5_9BACT|nr:hypothetical protein [Candidatus Methylomirabilis limnetica]PTL36789.1 hypothetical protein CLG94_02610 [Candidatus Methylomirabilis limnetica]
MGARAASTFTFAIERCALPIPNPCQAPLLHKSFRVPKPPLRPSLDRDAIDELIYRTTVLRTRLLLDPQARCGLRIGEVLSLTVACGTGRDAKPGWDFRHGVVEAIRRQGPPIKWGGLIPGHFCR